jgi:TRAP-type C4-dicarboxylate transport system permease small subunit
MNVIQRILGRSIDVTMILGAIGVLLMMAHITIDVIAKFFFNWPLPGTITIVSNHYMILVAFLPLAFAERQNGHISVEVLVEHFPARVQYVLSLFALMVGAIVFAMLAWQGWVEAIRAYNISAFVIEHSLRIPIWPARFLLPIGCGLMVLTLLLKIALGVRRGPSIAQSEPFF